MRTFETPQPRLPRLALVAAIALACSPMALAAPPAADPAAQQDRRMQSEGHGQHGQQHQQRERGQHGEHHRHDQHERTAAQPRRHGATGDGEVTSTAELREGERRVTIRSTMPSTPPNIDKYRVSLDDFDAAERGYVTRSQVPEDHPLHHEFHLVDRNRDGRVTEDELRNWR